LRDDGVEISIQPGPFGQELDPHVAGTVFSLIDEAVNNARKHAPGAPIRVTVEKEDGTLVARVRDEGPGFDVQAVHSDYVKRGSLGLVNMKDRARLVDGQLVIESAPGHGTWITLRVPLSGRRVLSQPDSSDNGSGL
jgi:signal transduction histidine kinase